MKSLRLAEGRCESPALELGNAGPTIHMSVIKASCRPHCRDEGRAMASVLGQPCTCPPVLTTGSVALWLAHRAGG